jgi:hypothetical protein
MDPGSAARHFMLRSIRGTITRSAPSYPTRKWTPSQPPRAVNAKPLYAMLAMYALRWKADKARRFRKLKAIPAVRKGATNVKENTPSEAIPDHFQNRAVRHTTSHPPKVANKIK